MTPQPSMNTWMLLLLLSLAGLLERGVFAQDPNSSPRAFLYKNNQENVADVQNIINMSLPLLQTRLAAPNATRATNISGFDWTQPYPGTAIKGFEGHLRIAYDVALPDDVVQNSTSTITSLTYSIPDSMMSDTGPKAMDPSWYVCRHLYIGSSNSTPVDNACDFLGSQCLADLHGKLTTNWGTTDPTDMCSGLTFDSIPVSCIKTFGYARADVSNFNSTVLDDPTQAVLLTQDKQEALTYRIGTGFHNADNPNVWAQAMNRTYLVVFVWGWSNSSSQDSRKTPQTTFTCLHPVANVTVPSNTTSPSTTTSTGTATPTASSSAAVKNRAYPAWFGNMI